MFYHASQIPGIKVLMPRISNHGKPLVYFSTKRENTLVYLSNAVEKYCRETGFRYDEPCQKWASYGFTKEGLLHLEEYYPNAIVETYKGVSGYIYSADQIPMGIPQKDIRDAVISSQPVEVTGWEFVPDAYEAILQAAGKGEIVMTKYENLTEKMLAWSSRTALEEYENAADHPEYRHFLKAKFNVLKDK